MRSLEQKWYVDRDRKEQHNGRETENIGVKVVRIMDRKLKIHQTVEEEQEELEWTINFAGKKT